jgi:lipid-A-disaccharide synthase-like uncharacterized protein
MQLRQVPPVLFLHSSHPNNWQTSTLFNGPIPQKAQLLENKLYGCMRLLASHLRFVTQFVRSARARNSTTFSTYDLLCFLLSR